MGSSDGATGPQQGLPGDVSQMDEDMPVLLEWPHPVISALIKRALGDYASQTLPLRYST